MFVKDWMTKDPVTVSSKTAMFEAQELLKKGGFRRLPVVDDGKLVGIVTDRDFKQAAPSDATSLSIYELSYLLNKLTVKSIMHKPVITVKPEDDIKWAAMLIEEKKISGLAVVDKHDLVGIITITDVLRGLLVMLESTQSSP